MFNKLSSIGVNTLNEIDSFNVENVYAYSSKTSYSRGQYVTLLNEFQKYNNTINRIFTFFWSDFLSEYL